MEFFTHVQKVYTEMNYETIQLDIPLAIFMIKLLSIKVDFINFKCEDNFNEYMKSDKPLKLRYYLQVSFREEMIKATEEAVEKYNEENKYIEESYNINFHYRHNRNPIPPYEKRIELYEKYLKDKDFDEDIQNKISEWIKPDMVNGSLNSQIKDLINNEIRKKYGQNPVNTKDCMVKFMHRFGARESVKKLLYSMRDVYILGLV